MVALVCLRGFLGTLCGYGGCGGCGDGDACTVVSVACLYAERVRGCEGDCNAGVGAREGVVAVSAGCECMGGTCGSGFVSTVDDVLEMSGVRGARGVCGVCEI